MLEQIRDLYLLKTWKNDTSLLNRKEDPAILSGATNVFVPRDEAASHPCLDSQAAAVSNSENREFTLATWNAENLVTSGRRANDWEKIKEKAEVLKEVNADVVALQEIGDLQTLDQFRTRLLGEQTYPYRILIQGNDPGINVGLLSKFPIKRAYTYRDRVFPGVDGQPMKFTRDLLEAVVQVTPQFPVKIFVCHLKSKRGGEYSDLRRESEAREVKRIISQQLEKEPESLIAVAGDFNDFPDSPAVKTVERGPNSVIDPLSVEKREYQPTHHSSKFGNTRLDYLLLSPELMKRYQTGSAEVREKENHGASDHDPLELHFRAYPTQKFVNQPFSSSSSKVINP
jgi:endonuclease/exonuclease/phosphatase family metal-dependent hydrolase